MTKRIALVTGGIGGIGSAICMELSNTDHQVVASYYPPRKEIAEAWREEMKSKGYDIGLVSGDVADFESASKAVQSVEKEFGPVDVLVNAAGITRDKTLKKMELEQWNAVINTNLNSAFNVTRQVIGGMLERGFGRIINIASVNGQKGQFGQANYSAAKAGLHGFTMAVAQETAAKGITVNTVSPGYILTPMTAAMPKEVLDSIVNSVPMRRLGKPEEIASVVAWLADERNAYITGANIPVNGGLFMSA
jgi:acetoacetyl-CoA reductase